MLAVTVLGFAAAGVLLPFVSGAAVRAEGIHRTLAAGLAADLLEQIVNTPFDETVARYDSYSELQGQVKDASGAVFADPIMRVQQKCDLRTCVCAAAAAGE